MVQKHFISSEDNFQKKKNQNKYILTYSVSPAAGSTREDTDFMQNDSNWKSDVI